MSDRLPEVPFMQVDSVDGSSVENPEAHVATARALAQAGRYEQAISQYSLALAGDQPRPEEYVTLLERSTALLLLSQRLREIPAAQSEANALYGLDPTHLAQLALRDATRAVALESRLPAAHLRQGKAYILLEQYSRAETALLEGLAADPGHEELQQTLRQLSPHLATADPSRSLSSSSSFRAPSLEHTEDMDCTLCLKLLYEPVTTPCGHTFCRPCFLRASDHSTKCPLCRTVLHVGRELPVTLTLKNILQRGFPEEYAQRQAEELQHSTALAAEEAPLPLFVMSCLLPGERMALNIFEPRYRLMVRRCMEGSRCFGMATISRNHALSEVACRAEIAECHPLPDGRFHLEIIGKQRFRIEASWEQDGYRMARPHAMTDDPVSPGSSEGAQLQQLCADVARLSEQWIERIRAASTAGRHSLQLMELLARAGAKPAAHADGVSHAEALSFWVTNLLPLQQAQRMAFARMTSTAERLRAELSILQQDGGSACRLM